MECRLRQEGGRDRWGGKAPALWKRKSRRAASGHLTLGRPSARQPRVYAECTVEMLSVSHVVTVPAKAPWHMLLAVPRLAARGCAAGHPAAAQGGSTLLEAARSPEAALKPLTEETLKVMDRWVSGARLFSTSLLPRAQMDGPSLWLTAHHTQHAGSGLPMLPLPTAPQFWGPGPFLSPAVCPAAFQAKQGCPCPLSPQEGISEARPPRLTSGTQDPLEQ